MRSNGLVELRCTTLFLCPWRIFPSSASLPIRNGFVPKFWSGHRLIRSVISWKCTLSWLATSITCHPSTTAHVTQRPRRSSWHPHSMNDTHFVARPRRVTAYRVSSGHRISQKEFSTTAGCKDNALSHQLVVTALWRHHWNLIFLGGTLYAPQSSSKAMWVPLPRFPNRLLGVGLIKSRECVISDLIKLYCTQLNFAGHGRNRTKSGQTLSHPLSRIRADGQGYSFLAAFCSGSDQQT